MDNMPSIIAIIRDAIADGQIRGTKMSDYKKNIKRLKGAALEEYLQELWDSFPEENSGVPNAFTSPNLSSQEPQFKE